MKDGIENCYITGDTHRNLDIYKLLDFNEECDKLIVCGDFGVPFRVWHNKDTSEDIWSRPDRKMRILYDNKPYETLFVDGNHENHDFLDRQRITEKFGGKVNQISSKITHLRRGEIYTINGKKIWVFGGATSVDRAIRTEWLNWWPREVASYAEMNHGINNLKAIGNKVDYIITHTPPESVIDRLFGNSIDCPVAKYLDYIMSTVKYERWYCGHMHIDRYMEDIKLQLLYNSIVKLGDIDDYCER